MRWQLVFAGISGAIMVGVGAWASHAAVGEIAREWLRTGAQYGLWHSLALLGVAALGARGAESRWLTFSAIAFAAGILLFSGSLFARALLGWSWISMATPLGGLTFIAGWLLLAAHGATLRRE
ncbi:MAG: DUF423 domain-containing protein [Proteobacteria bacterium]|nr:DUF423 domain-containing protein [Pseudomonadota bacterium]